MMRKTMFLTIILGLFAVSVVAHANSPPPKSSQPNEIAAKQEIANELFQIQYDKKVSDPVLTDECALLALNQKSVAIVNRQKNFNHYDFNRQVPFAWYDVTSCSSSKGINENTTTVLTARQYGLGNKNCPVPVGW